MPLKTAQRTQSPLLLMSISSLSLKFQPIIETTSESRISSASLCWFWIFIWKFDHENIFKYFIINLDHFALEINLVIIAKVEAMKKEVELLTESRRNMDHAAGINILNIIYSIFNIIWTMLLVLMNHLHEIQHKLLHFFFS